MFYIPVVILNIWIRCPLNERVKSRNSSVITPETHVHMLPSRLALLRVQLFGRPLLLGLPQMAGDGDGVNASGHGFGWDLTELLPV